MGENITVLSHSRDGVQGGDDLDRHCGYSVVRFSTKIGTGGWYRDPWSRRLLLTTLVREARRTHADYIVYNGVGGLPLFDFSLALAPRIVGIPAFIFIHTGTDLPHNGSKLKSVTLNWLMRSAAGVLLVSSWNLSLMDRFELEPKRVHVIHNGFDLREADSYLHNRNSNKFDHLDAALPIGAPNILCIARLNRSKRIDRLIRVMPRVLSSVPDARLAIAGTGDEEGQLRQQIADSPSKDSISLLGLVSPAEKFECYARCSLFALASDSEGFGLVFLEANAFGKPVVGTAIGGVPEAVEHDKSGLLVEPEDDQALADAIIELLNNPGRARRMGEYGRHRVESEFTWCHSAKKFRVIVHQGAKL